MSVRPRIPGWVRRLRRPFPAWQQMTLRTISTALVLGAVVVATVGGLLSLRSDTGPKSFLPAGDPALHQLHDIARSFGGDPVVVLIESERPGELLNPEQLLGLIQLEGHLSRLPDVAAVYGPGTVVNQLARSSQNLLATLSGRREAVRLEAQQVAQKNGATKTESVAAGEAAVRKFDRRYGALLVRGLPAGLPTVHNPKFVARVVFEEGGSPKPQWRFVVPSRDAVAILVRPREGIDQSSTERLVHSVRANVHDADLRTERVTVTGAPALTASLGEQVRREIPLLGGLASGLIAACYLAVPWLKRKRRRLIPLAATLGATAAVLGAFGLLGRPLSLGVVAFLPILIGIGSDFPAYLVRGADRRRVVVGALAAASGFASLAISPLPFVRDLGLALAAGVLLAVAMSLVLCRRQTFQAEDSPPSAVSVRVLAPTRRAALLVLAAGLAVTGWVILPDLDVEARPDRLAAGLPAVSDARHGEAVLGSSGEVQVVLKGPDILTPDALQWMRDTQDSIVTRHGSELRPIVSLPDLLEFLGPSPTPQQVHSAVELLPSYITGAVARPDGKVAVVSFGVGFQDLADQARLFREVRGSLPPTPDGYSAEVVGLPVAAARGYELISDDRYLSNTVGIAAAGVVLLAGLGRRSDALRAILAAVLATGWSLAGLWLLDASLTPLTVALGSLAVATACEFTVILTARRGPSTGAMGRTVGVAAFAACIGYGTLSLSQLSMISQFGLMLAGTVALSFLAAHLVVRALPRQQERKSDQSAAHVKQGADVAA